MQQSQSSSMDISISQKLQQNQNFKIQRSSEKIAIILQSDVASDREKIFYLGDERGSISLLIQILFIMSGQTNKRKLDPANMVVHQNPFGKKVYIYQNPNQSLIIPTHEEIHEFELIREMKKTENKKQAEKNFNLRTKPPTNLTKAQKNYEQKKLRQEESSFKKIKTSIHHDSVPSIICDEVFTECFHCIDKNHELSVLRQQKGKLSKQYQEKIQLLTRSIAQLQKSNYKLVQENQKLKKQVSKIKNEEQIQQMMQVLTLKSASVSNQSKISLQTKSSNTANPQSPRKEVRKYITEVVTPSSEIVEGESSQQIIRIDSDSDDQNSI